MTDEYVTYKGVPMCNVEKSLELQRWIIDPSSRPYTKAVPSKEQKLIARSAASEKSKGLSNIQIYREIRDKILNLA